MKKIEKYLLNNLEETQEIIEQINNINNSLEELSIYPMYMIDNVLSNYNIKEIFKMASKGNFNINDEYFIIASDGALESFDIYMYELVVEQNMEEIIDQIVYNFENLNLSKKLSKMIEELIVKEIFKMSDEIIIKLEELSEENCELI